MDFKLTYNELKELFVEVKPQELLESSQFGHIPVFVRTPVFQKYHNIGRSEDDQIIIGFEEEFQILSTIDYPRMANTNFYVFKDLIKSKSESMDILKQREHREDFLVDYIDYRIKIISPFETVAKRIMDIAKEKDVYEKITYTPVTRYVKAVGASFGQAKPLKKIEIKIDASQKLDQKQFFVFAYCLQEDYIKLLKQEESGSSEK